MRAIYFPLIILAILSCKGQTETNQSDQEKIAQGVRTYFFLNDSVDVNIEVKDTIFIDDLDENLETTNENIRLINLDIDTLGSMVDARSNELLDLTHEDIEPKVFIENDPKFLQLALRYEQLKAKELKYQQNKRLMLNLRRSQFNSIAGYETSASYTINGETLTFELLIDADFRVID